MFICNMGTQIDNFLIVIRGLFCTHITFSHLCLLKGSLCQNGISTVYWHLVAVLALFGGSGQSLCLVLHHWHHMVCGMMGQI